MKTYEGVDVWIHAFLISALVGGEWSASSPDCFIPGDKTPRYPWDMRLGGPQSRSGRHEEEKNPGPTGNRTPTPQPSIL
jgi:hypothetical protein